MVVYLRRFQSKEMIKIELRADRQTDRRMDRLEDPIIRATLRVDRDTISPHPIL